MRILAMICGALNTFSMFYVGVNYVPSLFLERQMGMANALLFTLIITSVQIPGKILNGLLGERIGRKAVYLVYMIPAAIGAYGFGQSTDKYVMLSWTCLFLFCASGAAPSYKMWYAEQYPTPIRATGQATVESIGGRLFGGVIWTMLFPIIVGAYGIATTMTILAVMATAACLIVVTFAPETYRRSVENLEAAAIAPAEAAAAVNPAQAG